MPLTEAALLDALRPLDSPRPKVSIWRNGDLSPPIRNGRFEALAEEHLRLPLGAKQSLQGRGRYWDRNGDERQG